jgi:thiosulfate/3-mercaptopyruvate sulfurtransferase
MTALWSPLVDTHQLASALSAVPGPDLPVVLDVRYRLGGPPGRPDYEVSHIPGAVFVDLDAELAGTPGPEGRHPLPEPARFQEVLRAAGVRDGSRVVAYDDGNGLAAVRAWWLMRWAGLPAGRVAVLDGGFAAWQAAGLPVTSDVAVVAPGDITVRAGSMPTVDAAGAERTGREGVLVDARAAVRFRGETEPVDPVAGHIPGAHNVPVLEFAGPDGRWLPPAGLAERFAGLKIGGDIDGDVGESADVVAYCGSGVTAAALVLAVEQAGLRPAERPIALYPGSWSNWVADPGRPVATGEWSPAS